MKKTLLLLAFIPFGLHAQTDSTDSIASTVNLDEVAVVAKSIVRNADGYSLNISRNKQLSQMDMGKALRFMPGFTNVNGKMNVYGNRIGKIYVNRRELRLSGNALEEYLRNLKGENVKKLEIITTAGAKEGAGAMEAAVIKITLHREDNGGRITVRTSGNMMGGAKGFTLPGIDLEIREGKWSFYGNGSLSNHWANTKMTERTQYYDTRMERSFVQHFKSNQHSQSTVQGTGYDFSPHTIFTIEHTYNHDKSGDITTQDNTERLGNAPSALYQMKTDGHNGSNGNNLSADLIHDWKTGDYIITANYAHSRQGNMAHQWRTDDRNLWNSNDRTAGETDLWQLKIDLNQRLGKKAGKLSYGASYVDWKNHQLNDNQIVKHGELSKYSFTDHYEYKEHTLSSYAEYRLTVGKLSFVAGTRFEHKEVTPRSLIAEEENHKTTTNYFFPTLRTSYRWDQKHGHTIQLSYTRTYMEPHMFMLNPHKKWSNDYSYTVGNPYLKAQRGHQIMGQFTFFNDFTLSTSYRYSPIFESVYGKEEGNIYYSSYAADARSRSYGVGLGYSKFMQNLLINVNLDYGHMRSKYATTSTISNTFTAMAIVNYMMKGGWNATFNTTYVSPMHSVSMSLSNILQMGLQLSKSFFDYRLNTMLSYTFQPNTKSWFDIDGIHSVSKGNNSPHSLMLTASYSLKWGKKSDASRNKDKGAKQRMRMD